MKRPIPALAGGFESPRNPDGPIAVEALRVIGEAMAEAGVVGLGRLTLSRRIAMSSISRRRNGLMALWVIGGSCLG